MRALLVVTPHSSAHVPQDILAAMLGAARDDPAARRTLLQRVCLQGDPYTDVLFDLPGTTALHAWASRFVVDVNRRRDAGGPNGVVKLTDFDSVPLYPAGLEPDEEAVEERLRRYWDPFHATLRRIVSHRRIELLLDGHSMTPTGPAIGPDRGAPRPAVTLMTGGDASGEPRRAAREPGPEPQLAGGRASARGSAGEPHVAPAAAREPSLAPELAREFKRLAEAAFASVLEEAADEVPPVVALNSPWSADELSYMHGPPAGVPAFGLELNRALFMDDVSGEARADRLLALRAALTDFVTAALAVTRRQAAGGLA